MKQLLSNEGGKASAGDRDIAVNMYIIINLEFVGWLVGWWWLVFFVVAVVWKHVNKY